MDYDIYTEDATVLEDEGPTQAPVIVTTEAENTEAEEAEGDAEEAPEDGLAGATAGI